MRIRVKICCIMSREERWLAIEAGASALGLASAMPGGPGVIPDNVIAHIASAIPPGIRLPQVIHVRDESAVEEAFKYFRSGGRHSAGFRQSRFTGLRIGRRSPGS